MLRVVIALGTALSFAGCTNSTIRSQEGHACSVSPSDDPQLMCTPAQDLICITTYSRPVTNPQVAVMFDGGIRQVWVCRLACNSTAECPQAGDVCCRGPIYGKTYNKMGGCVPPGSCETDNPEEDEDGGTPPPHDAAPKETGTSDTAASDTAAPDAGAPVADAPAGA
jgi:hypothetical protein